MDILRTSARGLNSPHLISLIVPIALKSGVIAKHLRGPLSFGRLDNECNASPKAFLVGTMTEKAEHIVIPVGNIASVQECNKIVKLEGLVEIP